MGDITKGYTFVNGERLTFTKLNNLFDLAVIGKSAISGKTEDTTPDWANDFTIEFDASANRLKKLRGSSLPGYQLQASPAFEALTVGTQETIIHVDPNKTSQNSYLDLTNNTKLRIPSVRQGMQGSLLVVQEDLSGTGYTVRCPFSNHGSIYNMLPGQPPTNDQVYLPIGHISNQRSLFNWTYLSGTYIWTQVNYF